jgi:hypothetical protein
MIDLIWLAALPRLSTRLPTRGIFSRKAVENSSKAAGWTE